MVADQAVNIGLSGNIADKRFHFTLQQIQRIGGKGAGLSEGAFARMLFELNDEELRELARKNKEADEKMRELIYKSYIVGEQIAQTLQKVEEKIDRINANINKLSGIRDGVSNRQRTSIAGLVGYAFAGLGRIIGDLGLRSREALHALKDKRRRLRSSQERLRAVDNARMQTSSVEDLDNLAEDVDTIAENVENIDIDIDDLDLGLGSEETHNTSNTSKKKKAWWRRPPKKDDDNPQSSIV